MAAAFATAGAGLAVGRTAGPVDDVDRLGAGTLVGHMREVDMQVWTHTGLTDTKHVARLPGKA